MGLIFARRADLRGAKALAEAIRGALVAAAAHKEAKTLAKAVRGALAPVAAHKTA